MPSRWDLDLDVVVLGSGGSALTAAILAHDGGAQTAVLEKAPVVGGTTAMSGGMLWAPNNHHMAEKGITPVRVAVLGPADTMLASKPRETKNDKKPTPKANPFFSKSRTWLASLWGS